MAKTKQLSLFKDKIKPYFGGSMLKGNAKVRRPLTSKQAIHLVLKSELAKGEKSFLRKSNSKKIDRVIREQADRWGIKLYHLINVGNHIHLVIKIGDIHYFRPFICAITGVIARHITGAEKGAAKLIKFWQARPFTRLIAWGKDFDHISWYLKKNENQGQHRRNLFDWGFGITDLNAIKSLNSG